MHGWVYGLHNGLLQDLQHDGLEQRGSRRPCSLRGGDRRRALAPQRELRAVHDGRAGLSRGAHRPARLRHRPGDARRLRPPLPAVPPGQRRRASAASRRADWHGQQRAQAQRIEYYDTRVAEATERLQTEFEAASLPMEVWQQVKLHYIGLLIDHHQPELRRDLLQLGDDEDPAPQLLPQRLHLRAAGGLDRIHRERRAGGAADLPRLLPDRRETLRATWLRIVFNFQLEREFEDLGRDVERRDAAVGEQLGDVAAARQFPDPGAVVAVLPQQGRLRRRQDHQRLPARRRSRCRSCTAAPASW